VDTGRDRIEIRRWDPALLAGSGVPVEGFPGFLTEADRRRRYDGGTDSALAALSPASTSDIAVL